MKRQKPKPFVKWAGGKRRLLAQYAPYFPPKEMIRAYREPMVGGGAVYYHMYPIRTAVLGDINEHLIRTYKAVRDAPDELIRRLKTHINDEDYYYQVRAMDPDEMSYVEAAARFIFLNRTCYNGLYRENKAGKFNSPFGHYKNPTICNEKVLQAASLALHHTILACESFEEIKHSAGADSPRYGDFVYFDPPYIPVEATSFVNYNADGFSADLQRELANIFKALTLAGVRCMLSQSSAPLAYELYDNPMYHLVEIMAPRSINSNGAKRAPVKELLVLNYEPNSWIVGNRQI